MLIINLAPATTRHQAANTLLAVMLLLGCACGSEEGPGPLETASVCSSSWQSLLKGEDLIQNGEDRPFQNIAGIRLHDGMMYVATQDLHRLPAIGGAIEQVAAVGGPITTLRLNEDGGFTLVKGNRDGDRIGQDSKGVLLVPAGGGQASLLLTLPRPSSTAEEAYYYHGPILLDGNALFAIRNQKEHTDVVRVDFASGEETPLFQAQRDKEGTGYYSLMSRAWNSTDWVIAAGVSSGGQNVWAISKTGQPHVRLIAWESDVKVLGVSGSGHVLWWESPESLRRFAVSAPGQAKRTPLKRGPDDDFWLARAWPLADGGWLVTSTQSFVDGSHLSINRLAPDGRFTRIACDPVGGRGAKDAQVTTEGVYLQVDSLSGADEIVYLPWN